MASTGKCSNRGIPRRASRGALTALRWSEWEYGTNLQDGLPDCNDALYPDDPSKLDDAWPPLQASAQFLEAKQKKPNDGLVTIQSAKWGTFMQCVPDDHMSEVGQLNLTAPDSRSGFWHLDFFRLVVSRLRDRGL